MKKFVIIESFSSKNLLRKQHGVKYKVRNLNGAMAEVVKASPADGYTIGFGAISTNALNPHIYKQMAFDPRKDFTAVSMLGYSTIVLTVAPQKVPSRNVQEFIGYAKTNPGLTYGTAGAGTSMHLAGAMFGQMTGTELVHVPYKGSGPGINDMLGGASACYVRQPSCQFAPHPSRQAARAGGRRKGTLSCLARCADSG